MPSPVAVEKVYFLQNRGNLGIENAEALGESRLWGVLTRFHFCEVQGKEFFNSKGPGRWSGQSGKELVLAAPFLHPEMERQAMEVGRSGSGGL